jgi:bifunctional DNA-binding transcriptional regulator/antitoxin component of YhaV-PrlF toxin-antitoxin module
MARVTSKYQVTVPKKIAEAYHIRPGHDIDGVPAGDVIRVIPPGKPAVPPDRQAQLRLFDQATERHRKRRRAPSGEEPRGRGWKSEDLYRRDRSR